MNTYTFPPVNQRVICIDDEVLYDVYEQELLLDAPLGSDMFRLKLLAVHNPLRERTVGESDVIWV